MVAQRSSSSGNQSPEVLAKAHNNRGNHYTRNGEYDRAIQDYDQSIKINPNYPKAFNNRGVAYQKKGEYERATKDFDEAIKLKPDYSIAFVNRAETYQKKGDYDRAAEDYDEFNPAPAHVARRLERTMLVSRSTW